MAFSGPGPGRPKGSKNKIGLSAKQAISKAAEGLGGHDRLVEWAKEAPENEKAFWTLIYPKLVPHEITGADEGPLQVHVVRFSNADDHATE